MYVYAYGCGIIIDHIYVHGPCEKCILIPSACSNFNISFGTLLTFFLIVVSNSEFNILWFGFVVNERNYQMKKREIIR